MFKGKIEENNEIFLGYKIRQEIEKLNRYEAALFLHLRIELIFKFCLRHQDLVGGNARFLRDLQTNYKSINFIYFKRRSR